MEVKYTKDGKLELDIEDLLRQLPEDQKLALMESFSCDEVIIKHVTDQLLDGCTDNGFWGAGGVASDAPYTALDKAKREVAKRSGEVAKKEIEALECALAREKEQHKEIGDKYWALYHAWRRQCDRGFDGRE